MAGLKEEAVGAALEWAVATRALPGQSVSGDMHVVQKVDRGVLLAVIDGIGHGEEALRAAKLAVDELQRNADQTAIGLMRMCHSRLGETRGAVIALAYYDWVDHTLTWTGVGNVECVMFHTGRRGRENLMSHAGTVGYLLPTLRAFVIPAGVGDLLVMATDGIDSAFAEGLNLDGDVQDIADRVINRSATGKDDALVLVARFRGKSR